MSERFRLSALISWVGVVWALSALLYGAVHYSKTYDEPFHIQWNRRLVDSAVTERESVYNYISTTPVLVPNVLLSKYLSPYFGHEYALLLERIPNVLWFIVLLLAVRALARRLSDHRDAPDLAMLFVCLEPSLLAHSTLVTVDIPFAALLVLVLVAFYRFMEHATSLRALNLGILTGLILVSKFTAIFIFPFFVLGLLVLRPEKDKQWFWGRMLFSGLVIIPLCVLVVINSAYFWINVGVPLGEYNFFNPLFQSVQKSIPNLRIPLPYDFISGFDHLSMAGQRDEWNNIIFAQWYGQGVWFYYAALFFLKTPLGLIVLFVAGLLSTFRFSPSSVRQRKEHVLTLLLAVALVIHFSLFVKVQVGYRYVLMSVVLLIVIASIGISKLNITKRARVAILFVCVLGALLELLPFSSNLLSFSNAIVYPKKHAYRYLADSNLDWGQNRDRRHEAFVRHMLQDVPFDPVHILPGKNVFSVNQLLGVFWNFEQHRWIRDHGRPLKHINHTELLFEVSQREFYTFMSSERTVQPVGDISSKKLLDLRPGGRLSLNLFKRENEQLYHVMVEEPTYLRFQIGEGIIELGGSSQSGQCEKETVRADQEVWYLLEMPGVYAFCWQSTTEKTSVQISSREAKSMTDL